MNPGSSEHVHSPMVGSVHATIDVIDPQVGVTGGAVGGGVPTGGAVGGGVPPPPAVASMAAVEMQNGTVQALAIGTAPVSISSRQLS